VLSPLAELPQSPQLKPVQISCEMTILTTGRCAIGALLDHPCNTLSINTGCGRDEEIDLLLRRWQQAKRGHGCAVLISGEPRPAKSPEGRDPRRATGADTEHRSDHWRGSLWALGGKIRSSPSCVGRGGGSVGGIVLYYFPSAQPDDRTDN